MGRVRLVLAATVLGLLLSSAPATAADEFVWRTFGSADVGFRVELPDTPDYEHASELTLAGRVQHHHHQVDLPGVRIDIERHDLPAVALVFFSPDSILDRAARDLVSDLGASLRCEEKIELQGQPGRRLCFELGLPPHPEESRLFLLGRHLYIVAAGPYESTYRESVVNRFFESFRLCGEDVAPGG